MSINFLDHKGKTQVRYNDYKQAILKGFKENGKKINLIQNTDNLKKGDIIIIGHYEDIKDKKLWNNKDILKITHFHSCYTPRYIKNDLRLEKQILSRRDYISIVNCNWEKELLEKKYNTNVYKLGFPLFLDKLKQIGIKQPKTILSSGRFDKSKNIELCYYFLSILQKKGYKVKFCSSKDQKEKYKQGFYDRYNIETVFLNRKQFQKELARSEFYFNTTLPETFGIGVIEALINNCYCILPKGKEYSYSDFYNGGYSPYSLNEIEILLEKKPVYNIDIGQYNYNNFVKGLLRIINFYIL